MKKVISKQQFAGVMLSLAMMSMLFVGCEKDDSDFNNYTVVVDDDDDSEEPEISEPATPNDTISIAFADNTAVVSGENSSLVTVSGADVIVNDATSSGNMVLVLSGSTADGSLLVYRQRQFTVILNGVSITNTDGPAINNLCGKSLFVVLADGTDNTLADGMEYAAAPVNANGVAIDQKAAFFSEGQMYFRGTGTLNVYGNSKNGIASDDYIVFEEGTVNVSVADTGTNGVKVNDGLTINGGVLTIDVAADGARGIKNDARTTITGGTTTITTSGDCKIETINGIADTTSCACIKSDSLFTMTEGKLTMTSTGDGGKGINCSENIEVSGGVFTAKTTGDNEVGKPKAVKSDTGIILSGGSFTASVKKSWACDNGSDSELPADQITIVGTPLMKSVAKKTVIVNF